MGSEISVAVWMGKVVRALEKMSQFANRNVKCWRRENIYCCYTSNTKMGSSALLEKGWTALCFRTVTPRPPNTELLTSCSTNSGRSRRWSLAKDTNRAWKGKNRIKSYLQRFCGIHVPGAAFQGRPSIFLDGRCRVPSSQAGAGFPCTRRSSSAAFCNINVKLLFVNNVSNL